MKPTVPTKVIVRQPCAALRPFVKRLLVVEFPVETYDYHLPDTGFVAAFRISGECSLDNGVQAPSAALTGLWDTIRSHRHSAGNMNVLASFTPLGAAAFLCTPLNEFFNRTTEFADIPGTPKEFQFLPERLSEAKDHSERLSCLESELLGLGFGLTFDPIMAEAVSRIEGTRGIVRIPAIAQQIGLSQSALERRFKLRIGTTPKKFASLVRLQNVLRLRSAGNDFSRIAHAAGYADQSHLIKDFRRITDQAPEAFFRGQHIG